MTIPVVSLYGECLFHAFVSIKRRFKRNSFVVLQIRGVIQRRETFQCNSLSLFMPKRLTTVRETIMSACLVSSHKRWQDNNKKIVLFIWCCNIWKGLFSNSNAGETFMGISLKYFPWPTNYERHKKEWKWFFRRRLRYSDSKYHLHSSLHHLSSRLLFSIMLFFVSKRDKCLFKCLTSFLLFHILFFPSSSLD